MPFGGPAAMVEESRFVAAVEAQTAAVGELRRSVEALGAHTGAGQAPPEPRRLEAEPVPAELAWAARPLLDAREAGGRDGNVDGNALLTDHEIAAETQYNTNTSFRNPGAGACSIFASFLKHLRS